MADIFLSYAEEDREAARKLVSLLEGAGWSVWWDRRIPAGKTWRAVLDAALDEMRCMVVLWSRRSIASDWVIEEAEEGRARAKLLPILIDAVLPPRGFRQIQALDFSQWDQTADANCVNLLMGDIESFIGKPSRSVEPAGRVFVPPPVSTLAFVSSDPQRESDKQPVEAVPSRPALTDRTRSRAPDQNHGAAHSASAAVPWASNQLLGIVAALIVVGAITAAAFVQRTHSSKLQREGEPASASVAPAESPPAVEMNVPVTTPVLKKKLEDESAESSQAPVKRLPTIANPKKADALEKVERRSAPERCSELLSRAQLGEPLQAEEQTFLRNECR